MFTGIIEKTKTVVANDEIAGGRRLVIDFNGIDLVIGESIAIDGVCLTVLNCERLARFDLSAETLSKTNLASLKTGALVNVEFALGANARIGGHFVTGHVDKIAEIREINQQGDFTALRIGPFSAEDKAYLLQKGSISVNGVSLTINDCRVDSIGLMLIPHSLAQTNLKELTIGSLVNIEFDYLAKIIAHQVQLMKEVLI